MQTREKGPITVTDYVVNSIRERILTGEYSAGMRLDQQTLIEDLGASLIPVRESLRQLEGEGFVQILPHRGAFVAELSINDLQEIYLVREVLEETATGLAVPNLSKRTLQQLGGMVEKMELATQLHDYAQLIDLNREFHFTIYSASNNNLLIQMITSLWDRSRRYRQLYTRLPERNAQALIEHKEIHTACENNDIESAKKAVRNNVHQTTVGILEQLRASAA